MIPKYLQLKEKLSEEISQKKYPLFSKLPTEAELSKQYGVSRATVRQALEILKADGIIEKRWGSGNTVISTYGDSKKNTVALVFPGISPLMTEADIADLKFYLYKEDLNLEIFETGDRQSREREILELITKDLYAGYIIIPSAAGVPSLNTEYYQKLLRRQIPLLFAGSGPDDMENAPVLATDDYECGYMCARHFINRGVNDIGAVFICNDVHSMGHFSGYSAALRDLGVIPDEDSIYWLGPNESLDDLKPFCSSVKEKVSAFVCENSEIASYIYRECAEKISQDNSAVSLVCCLNIPSPEPTVDFNFSHAETVSAFGKEICRYFLQLKRNGTPPRTRIGYKIISGNIS